jgi:predicted kinase
VSERASKVGHRTLEVPELSLVVLVGPSGSGKSTFAKRHFLRTEVVSSDFCRGLVADDENDQSATKDAFELLHYIVGKRMAAGRLAVVDATNVKREDRAHLVRLAREHHFLPVAIVFDLPERLCHDRNRARPERDFGPHVIGNQIRDLRRGLRGLRKEGFRQVHVLSSADEVEAASITRTRLWSNRTDEHGPPFDIIGDVHGCCDELERLLGELGYRLVEQREGEFPHGGPVYTHPDGRTGVFLGDLVDRGPRILDTIRLVRNMVEAGSAHCVPGNHEMKLVRKLRGRDVQITHGLERSLAELDALPEARREAAAATYAQPARPFLPEQEAEPVLTAQQREDELLDVDDVLGKRIVATRLARNVTIREENATAALEVMGRFAINPKWLVYLPPTVSPSSTSREPDVLEHPAEAFAYYRGEGVARVVCEEKHMGSRAVVVVCRDEAAARRRFGVVDEGFGTCFTRTGRRFFDDDRLESGFLTRIRDAVANAGLFERFESDWALLDCELMPWSAKAQELLRSQYAAVGAAARAGLGEARAALEAAGAAGVDTGTLLGRFHDRAEDGARFVDAYRRYCWPVRTIDDLELAPFHLLATAGAVHVDKTHVWHMETLAELCAADRMLQPTAFTVVDTTEHDSEQAGGAWWAELTARGGEGMVLKPLDFVVRGRRGLVQPALKTRGREYLRIIYGPEYTQPENLERVRDRGLGRKRSLAVREFALGIEALERFVRGEPLRRVHECVFGVLALESEPVDPRL